MGAITNPNVNVGAAGTSPGGPVVNRNLAENGRFSNRISTPAATTYPGIAPQTGVGAANAGNNYGGLGTQTSTGSMTYTGSGATNPAGSTGAGTGTNSGTAATSGFNPTWFSDPTSTMMTGYKSSYNPLQFASQETANALGQMTGAPVNENKYLGMTMGQPQYMLGGNGVSGGMNAGLVADAIRRYGSIDHPAVQQILKNSQDPGDAGISALQKQAQTGMQTYAQMTGKNPLVAPDNRYGGPSDINTPGSGAGQPAPYNPQQPYRPYGGNDLSSLFGGGGGGGSQSNQLMQLLQMMMGGGGGGGGYGGYGGGYGGSNPFSSSNDYSGVGQMLNMIQGFRQPQQNPFGSFGYGQSYGGTGSYYPRFY